MKDMEKIPNEFYIFGSLFIVANNLDTLLERELAEFDITTKQWLLTITIDSLFDAPPSIKQVAKAMGSSHQNVKQVALKLQERGFVILDPDPKDARVTNIVITDKYRSLWEKTAGKGDKFMKRFFENIDKGEIEKTRKVLEKLWANLEKIKE